MKRAIALVLVAVMCLLCWGCGKKNPADQTPSGSVSDAPKYDISLAFCGNDYLNPYTCVTKVNRMLSKLIFEPLVSITDEYETVNVLASEVSYLDSVITVKIKDNIVFSDGSALTSADVKYSFDLAKNNDYIFSSELSTITSCSVIDSFNLSFIVSKNDPFAINLLTFPIIKSGSDQLESSDNVLYDPIGTGRYVRNDYVLSVNENYRSSDTALKSITLVNTPDSEALEHCISAGLISVYYSDIADGNIPKMMGKSMPAALSNLVYIGFNDNAWNPVSGDIRQIISGIIDRTAICEQAFVNYAVPASGLYPEKWNAAEGLQTILPTADVDNMLAKLWDMGYNVKDNDGYYANEKGNIISLDLLVNEESKTKTALAQLLVTQLKDAGIKLNIVFKNYNDYISALSSGNYQLYIGEVHFKDNLDVSGLLLPGGSAAYGINNNSSAEIVEGEEIYVASTQDKIREFYSGKALFSDILIYFMSELPVIPVCYRSGWLGFEASIPDNILKPWLTDAYHGIWQLG